EIAEIKSSESNPVKRRHSFREKSEYEQLEKDIAELEIEKETLTGKLNNGIADHKEMIECSKHIGKIISVLEKKGLRWLELSEIM
ncbi:MAG: ABC transporter C-terminal domain-containing protein, partial [Bacteroidota bacterium]